MNIIIMF